MSVVATIVLNIAIFILWALQLAMMIRAILGWFPGGNESRVADFLYSFTEPLILPVRKLFYRRGWFRMSPLDVPFFVTYLVIMVLTVILESLR